MENIKNKINDKGFKEEESHTFYNERSQNEGTKKHGIKDSDPASTSSNPNNSEVSRNKAKNESQKADNNLDGSNAELADPNETNEGYLNQPQSLSPDLESIYAGAPSTKEEREALAQQRKREKENDSDERKNLGQAGYSSGEGKQDSGHSQSSGGDKGTFVDTERGNYSKHKDYQDRQGHERNKNLEDEFPNGERNRYSHIKHGLKDSADESSGGKGQVTDKKSSYGDGKDSPNFPSSMENKWDDSVAGSKKYGETDFDDEEVRRRQDEGNQPWDESTGDNIDEEEQ